ncbi:MAG TPA: hypothetical protein ENI29_13195 [bacterium]|nr:hypothetical protein [bacterium]
MASLKISEKSESKSLILNLDFPVNYKLDRILAFKRYILDFGRDDSNKEDSFFQELESLKQFTITNKEKREEYINLVKFRRDLKKFIEQTVQEYLRVNYQTPEYKKISEKLKNVNIKQRLARRNKNKDKVQKLEKFISFLEEGEEIIKDEQYEIFEIKKKKDFEFLRTKLWRFWQEIYFYYKLSKSRIKTKLSGASEKLKENFEYKNRLNNEVNKINEKIEELLNFHKTFRNPNAIILLFKNSKQILETLKEYGENLKRELPKKVRKKNVEEILKKIELELNKKKIEEELISNVKDNNSLLLHDILSKSFINFKIFKIKSETNKLRRLSLVFDKTKLYENFYSSLVVSSQKKELIQNFYSTKDSYLVFNYRSEELQALLKKNKLLPNNIVKTKYFGGFLGIKINFIEIATILFKSFTKNQPALTPNVRSTRFQRLRLDTKIKKRAAVSVFLIFILILGLILTYLFRSQSIVVQKYDLVKINYQMWESDARKNYNILNPLYDDTIWITIIPITENSTSGLILGLYDNLLGSQKYYESDLIWLDKCIDQDRNGIDDFSGEPALSFGNSTDLYFNTHLMIKFEVLDIQKMH